MNNNNIPRFKKPNVAYTLGIDLGVASVGWSVMAKKTDPTKPYDLPIYSLHDFGVHLFDEPADLKSRKTFAAERRGFRSQRRLIRRRTQRIKRIQKVFLDAGFDHNDNNKLNLKETNKILVTLDKKNQEIDFNTETGHKNIYVLKYKAMKKAISPEELYLIFLHSCKKRGYLNKFESEKDQKKFSEIIKKTNQSIENLSLSEGILRNPNFRINDDKKNNEFLLYVRNGKLNTGDYSEIGDSTYRYLFSRKSLENELNIILNFQTTLQNRSLFWKKIKNLGKELIDIVITQRDFEMGPKCRDCQKNKKCLNPKTCSRYDTFLAMIGKCLFYPNENRGSKASLLFIAFHFCVELSKMLQGLTYWEINFTEENYFKLLEIFFKQKSTITEFKNFLEKEVDDPDKLAEVIEIKNKAWQEGVDLKKKGYLQTIHKIPKLEKLIQKLDFSNGAEKLIEQLSDVTHPLNVFGKILAENKTPNRLEKKLKDESKKNNLNLSDKEIEKLMNEQGNFSGNAKISFSKMKDIIKIFLSGNPNIQEEQADYSINFIDSKKQKNLTKLRNFLPLRDKDMEKNPVVSQAINETRKVLKALDNHYGEFKSITIELARDITDSLKNRNEKTKLIKLNEKKNNEIKDFLLENDMADNKQNILRYKLCDQQNEKCLYCGIFIDKKNIDSVKFQVDHIVPNSVWGDNSMKNKILACARCNASKGNRLPLEFLSFEDARKFEQRIKDCESNKKNILFPLSKKKIEYLKLKSRNTEILQEFISRALNDTRYIGKWFSAYVKKQVDLSKYKTKVLVVPGGITSFLRTNWLFHSAWGLPDKVREITHFHHAVDAMILAQLQSQEFIELIYDIKNLSDLWRTNKSKELSDLKSKIFNKWDKLNQTYKNKFQEHLRLLENWIEHPKKFQSIFFDNFANQIEKRIPVKLEIVEDDSEKRFPKYVDILNEEEWLKSFEGEPILKEQNLKFPHISRRKRYKLPKSLFARQQFGFLGGDKEAKLKAFKVWNNNNKIFNSQLEELIIKLNSEIIVRKELKKIYKNFKKEETLDSNQIFPNKWSLIFHQNKNLKNKIHKIMTERNRTLPSNLIAPLIQLTSFENKKEIERKIKIWIKEFEDQKTFIVKNNNSVLSLEKYYGFFIDSESREVKWINNYEAQQIMKKRTKENQKIFDAINQKKNLFVKNTLFQHYDDNLQKEITKNYFSKAGPAIYIFPNFLTKGGKTGYFAKHSEEYKIFDLKNINTFVSKKIKILKIDILGNLLHVTEIND